MAASRTMIDRQYVEKQKHHFADTDPYVAMVFSLITYIARTGL